MVFLVLFIIICSYFISGFGAGNIYLVYYVSYFLYLYFTYKVYFYIDVYKYSCCLA